FSERWQTNTDGNFQAKITPGHYTLTVERFGYETVSVPVVVSNNHITQLTVELPPLTTGTITGTVVDQVTGMPIADAEVAVVGVDLRTTSAADGTFTLSNLPVGEYRVRVRAAAYTDSISGLAPVAAGAQTRINYRLAKQISVLVVGDSGRSVDFLSDHQLLVAGAEQLPQVSELQTAKYDVIVMDHPPEVSVDHAQAFVNYLAEAGTGVLWLDLGYSEDAGIAQISRLTGSPVSRSGAQDSELTRIGYHIHTTHPIFTRGFSSASSFGPNTLLVQNERESGTKYYAAFGDIPEGEVLASTLITHPDGTNEDVGNGIAISEYGGHRSVYFALHGTAPSFDTRNWSHAFTQVFLNAINWSAPAPVSAVAPEISEPQLPAPTPDPEPIPTDPDTPPWAPPAPPPAGSGGSGVRPPTVVLPPVGSVQVKIPPQLLPKPKTVPPPAFGTESALRAAPGNGVKITIKNNLATVTLPGAKPGDWYYLYMYPNALAVDWLRVGPDGTITLDIGKLGEKRYALAFTNHKGRFAGWVDLDLRGDEQPVEDEDASAPAPPPSPASVSSVTQPASVSNQSGLSELELALLGGSGMLFLAAAFVLVGAARRKAV
ncbi:MAG: carboxypeptidase-like regulatory domain-containing protein, partial [Bowdeniella nasicola]|nr:carboxypeptidase-like regulatory domain-containing protein [Bowdeniella nasicola]